MKKRIITTGRKEEIFWNAINSMLAGSLVFLGSFTTGGATMEGLKAAIVVSSIVAISKFTEYWKKEEREYRHRNRKGAFSFI